MPSPTPSTPDSETSLALGDRTPTDEPVGSVHDAAWFEALVRQHATAVHRFVVRRAGRDDAEDLAADVLTVAWRRRADVPDGAELPWLYRTAGFVVANHRRKGRPVPVADVPDDVDSDDPAVRAVQEERVREVLGIGRGGADAALSRARARLREAWASAEA